MFVRVVAEPLEHHQAASMERWNIPLRTPGRRQPSRLTAALDASRIAPLAAMTGQTQTAPCAPLAG